MSIKFSCYIQSRRCRLLSILVWLVISLFQLPISDAWVPIRTSHSNRHDATCLFSSKHSRPSNKFEYSRREALGSAFVASSVILSSPSVSSAAKDDLSISAFDNLQLGTAEWTSLHDVYLSHDNILLQSSKLVPPNFATYLTRFLIRYDAGISKWWNDLEMTYSLLPSATKRSKVGHNFGDLAKSLQISIGTFISLNQPIEEMSGAQVQEKYQALLQIFVDKYTIPQLDDTTRSTRDIAVLFSILPDIYQPLSGIQSLVDNCSWSSNHPVGNSLSVAFTEELTELLPDSYSCVLDKATHKYEIVPSLGLYEIGVDDEFGQSATATFFGPLSSSPLRRQKPDLSLGIYALFGLSGALGCAITHSAVIPFDVVKTRLQTNPEQYSNLIDGAVTIAKEEGVEGFLLGSQATIVGYLWYGLSVYPLYAFFKFWLGNYFLSPAFAVANADGIAFLAGMIAAVIASIGLTPIEACRIRTVSDPQTYRPLGLVGTAQSIAREDSTLGWKSLYNGLSSLMIRQVIFGGIKFLAFERACDAFFLAWPALRDTTLTSLMVTVVGGASAGAISSIFSQPADSVLTYIANNKKAIGRYGLIEGVQDMIKKDGLKSLFNGLGSRCLWASVIISGQFLLYDIFRSAFGINYQDLSQVFELNISST